MWRFELRHVIAEPTTTQAPYPYRVVTKLAFPFHDLEER